MIPEDKVPETPAQDATELDDGAVAGAAEANVGEASVGEAGAGDAVTKATDASAEDELSVDPRVDDVLGEVSENSADSSEGEGGGSESGNALDDLQAKLAAAETRADENWDRLLRMQADVENKNKRSQRDVQNARKFALEGVANDLLPIRDSLEMGLAAAQEEAASVESIKEGSELTLKMLASAMEKHQICELNPVGEKFNPEFHQAMSMLPAEDGTEPNTVIHVMQKGYTLNERLIRPALVTVAK